MNAETCGQLKPGIKNVFNWNKFQWSSTELPLRMSQILCDCKSHGTIHRTHQLDFQPQCTHSTDDQDSSLDFSFRVEVMKCYQICRIEPPTVEYGKNRNLITCSCSLGESAPIIWINKNNIIIIPYNRIQYKSSDCFVHHEMDEEFEFVLVHRRWRHGPGLDSIAPTNDT